MDTLLGIVQECCATRYSVERELGRGGTAVVYLATDLRHRRLVALKVLHPELALIIGADRFHQEIEIAARLNHPHILPLLDSGSISMSATVGAPGGGRAVPVEVPYYVMPFVPDESLHDRLSREGTLELPEAIRITREVADALDYAHKSGIVHRDIKPENILLSGGHAVVADFGIARALNRAGAPERVTRTGFLVGTPYYMSPEQISGDESLDGRSDLYSLACVLYEMLAGQAPQGTGSVQAVLARRLSEPPPTLRTSGIIVPPAVEAALDRALAPDRARRFTTGAEFAAALTAPEALSTPSRIPRSAWVAIPGILLIALVAILFQNRHPAPGSHHISSVAVLPLTEAVADPSTAYLREGIPEAVADLLQRLPGLAVTAPSLVTQLLNRQPDADLRDLGRRLGVESFLTGRMRRWGDSLSLRSELVRVQDGQLLWGRTYEVPFANLQDLERQIVGTIADTLRLAVSGSQAVHLASQPIKDAVAYDEFLRGRHLWTQAAPLGTVNARALADSVLYYAGEVQRRAPEFAGGYFLEGAFYSLASIRGWRSPFGPAADSGRTAARRAIEIDPQMAEAWLVLGILSFYSTDDWAETRRLFHRTVELNPTDADGQYYWALYLAEVERELDSAIAHLRATARVDSQVSVLNSMGDIYLRARKYDSAITVLTAAVKADPAIRGPRNRLVRAFEAQGRFDSALRVREGAPDTAGVGLFATALAANGVDGYRRELAGDLHRRIDSIERAMKGPKDEIADTIPPLREHRIAALYAELGEWSKAADWVLKEYARRPGRLRTVVADPNFDGLRSNPRIAALARQNGLSALLQR